MTSVDIDRILRDEHGIEPSARFTSRVMRAVRSDVADRHGRRLAWRQVWPVAAAVSVAVPVAIAARVLGESRLPAPVDPVLLLTLTIVGTAGLLSWFTGLVTRH